MFQAWYLSKKGWARKGWSGDVGDWVERKRVTEKGWNTMTAVHLSTCNKRGSTAMHCSFRVVWQIWNGGNSVKWEANLLNLVRSMLVITLQDRYRLSTNAQTLTTGAPTGGICSFATQFAWGRKCPECNSSQSWSRFLPSLDSRNFWKQSCVQNECDGNQSNGGCSQP